MKRQPKPIIDYTTWTQEQFEHDLRTNPKYTAYFAEFDEEHVDTFIKHLAADKAAIFSQLRPIQEDYEANQTYFLTLADDLIDIILQKKLFNLQCLWRAGEIDLPFVNMTTDFDYFENHIRDCPFIEPITERELQTGIRFLENNPFLERFSFVIWQNYDGFKTQKEEEGEDENFGNPGRYPELYAHFDLFQGTLGLFKYCSNKRGEAERRYCRIGVDAEKKEKARQASLKEPVKEGTPTVEKKTMDYFKFYLNYDLETRTKFINTFEDDQIKEAFVMHDSYLGHHASGDFHFEWDLYFLADTEEDVPIMAHHNWKEAITESAVSKRVSLHLHGPSASHKGEEIHEVANLAQDPSSFSRILRPVIRLQKTSVHAIVH